MAIKTFNVDEETYAKFSSYCKDLGLSMSKQVDMFMKSQIEEEPVARKEYLEKLDRIQKYGKFIRVKGSLMDRYKDV
jgi:antitoxin component of RelBE/YafQ-DinJ toxin-antitoxin module